MQFIEQRLRLLQIERVEAFGEPAIDRSEQFARLLRLSLIAPQPRHTPSQRVIDNPSEAGDDFRVLRADDGWAQEIAARQETPPALRSSRLCTNCIYRLSRKDVAGRTLIRHRIGYCRVSLLWPYLTWSIRDPVRVRRPNQRR